MAANYSIVGESKHRVDGLEKVLGKAAYTVDVSLPGMLYGKIVRSPHAHARVVDIDTSKALALEGVEAVITIDDVPRVLHAGAPAPRIESHVEDQYIFDEKVRFVGDGVAAVAAASEELAREAADLIEVEYELLPAVFDVEVAMQPDAPKIHDTEKNLVMPPIQIQKGDIEKGFKEADYIFEGEYSTGRPTHCYMEPMACVAAFDAQDNLTVWVSTQNAFMVRGILSEVLDIPLSKIRVIVEYMGGGFGGKQDLYQHEFICVLLAEKTGRPVKMEYTRKESFVAGKTRHPVNIYLKQGVREDGMLTARQMRYVSNSGAYASHGPGITAVGCYDSTSLFRCENIEIEGYSVYTNNPVAGAFRGYGAVQAYFALDSQMDEIAAALDMDPVELRLRNVVGEGDITGSGHKLPGNGLEACLRRGAEEVSWHDRRGHEDREGHIKRGWGVGVEMHPASAYPSIKEESDAEIKILEDGSVVLLTGAADLGTGALTAMAQIAAEELGIPWEDIRVIGGDTDLVPYDIGAYCSRTTFVAGGAVQKAARELKSKVLSLAADEHQISVDQLDLTDGKVVAKDSSLPDIPLRDLVIGKGGRSGKRLVARVKHETEVAYSFAAHFAQVEVNTQTGQIAVKKVVAVHEVGQAINPRGVEGQVEGGIQQGIGHTLTEHLAVDHETGRILNPNFVDYKIPLALDMPDIKTIILEEVPSHLGPFGAKGVGEDPILAIGQAVANAVYDAIGVRFRNIPITPEDVLQRLSADD